MGENIMAAFFIVGLFAPVLAVLVGLVILGWPTRRAARTSAAHPNIAAHT